MLGKKTKKGARKGLAVYYHSQRSGAWEGASRVLGLGAAHTGVLARTMLVQLSTNDVCGLLHVARLQFNISSKEAGGFVKVANKSL